MRIGRLHKLVISSVDAYLFWSSLVPCAHAVNMPRKRKVTTKKKTASTKRTKTKAAVPKAAKTNPGGVVVEIEACKSWCV